MSNAVAHPWTKFEAVITLSGMHGSVVLNCSGVNLDKEPDIANKIAEKARAVITGLLPADLAGLKSQVAKLEKGTADLQAKLDDALKENAFLEKSLKSTQSALKKGES
jgi:hypothetical protein